MAERTEGQDICAAMYLRLLKEQHEVAVDMCKMAGAAGYTQRALHAGVYARECYRQLDHFMHSTSLSGDVARGEELIAWREGRAGVKLVDIKNELT